MKKKTSKIVILLSLLFLFLLPSLFNQIQLVSGESPETSDDVLYLGQDYPFHLDDYYDDSDPAHVYTGAKLQKEYVPTSTVYEESVSYVNNSESQTPYNIGVSMINGTFGNQDNMHVDDNSYSTFQAQDTNTYSYDYDSPSQWGEFSFTKGSGTTAEDIVSNNGVYNTLTSGITATPQTAYHIIRPDADVYNTGWTTTPCWDDIDDNIIQPTAGDGLYTKAKSSGSTYTIWFSCDDPSLQTGGTVTDVTLWVYAKKSSNSATGIKIQINSPTGTYAQAQVGLSLSYAWYSVSFHFPTPIPQSHANNLQIGLVSIKGSYTYYYYVDVAYLYLTESYDTNTYSFDYEVSWGIPSGTATTLYYDYATSVALDCDLDIWDYIGSTWVELQSNTGTGYITSSYDLLANPNKVSSGTIKLRFQTDSYASNFEMYIDQLTIYYSTIIAGDSILNFTIQSPAFTNHVRDDLLALKITSNHYTNISTLTTTKIWNYQTSTWVQLWSATRTSEYSESYTITSNINQYFDGNGKILLNYTNTDSDSFMLYIDYIQFLLVDKLDLVHTTSFDKVGEWKIRWEVQGSVYYTSWVSYQVIGMANFEAISESDYTTRWVLQNSTISAVEDFHDDINTDYWNLVDVGSNSFDYTYITTGDSHTYNTFPDTNYGSTSNLVISDDHRGYFIFPEMNSNYLFENQSGYSQIFVYTYLASSTVNYQMLTTQTSFSENTITWNNQPSPNSLQDTLSIGSSGWKAFDISDFTGYYVLKLETESGLANIGFRSREYSSNKPYFIRDDVCKNYFGSGYMYMQTNTNELIGLLSKDYGTHKTLSSGDYFEVDLQTNSDSKIELKLYKDSSLQKTLTLSPSGNTNFNRHTVKISVSESLEFDQLKISSTFEDEDYMKIWDIKTYKYSLVGDSADFYLGSKRSKEIYLTASDSFPYNLR
ncbi:MAG: hypothetical protein EU535_08520, partial [Promethearchaeota archaeon]